MIYILTAIALWSSLGIFLRYLPIPLQNIIFFTCSTSSLLIAMLFLRKAFRDTFPRGRKLLPLILVGPISLLNTFSFFYAYQNTTIANAVLTHYTAPVLVAFMAPIFLNEKLTIRILAAVIVATAGLWIMLGISPEKFFSLLISGDRNSAGILAGLLSGFFYAALVILIRAIALHSNPLVMTLIQNTTIALILAPFFNVPAQTASSLWLLLLMGVLHSTIAPILYYRGIQEVTANRTAILGYLEPVCAIILGVLFLNESLNLKTILGGLMILLSGYITIRSK